MIFNKKYIFILSIFILIVYVYNNIHLYQTNCVISYIYNFIKFSNWFNIEGSTSIKNIKNIDKNKLNLVSIQQNNIKQFINQNINEFMKDDPTIKLKEILKYALEDGKRVRPIIILTNYNKLSNTSEIKDYIVNISLSIEYIHCASLILDDMMDNDDYRRDRLSLHKKYGNTMSQLCAIILCAYAMKNIFTALNQLTEINKDNHKYNKNIPIILGNMFSNCISELTIGQFIDINVPTSLYTLADLGDNIKDKIKMGYGFKNKYTIEELIHKKTTTLFEYCYIMPWVFSNYDKTDNEIEKGILEMKNIAKHFGLIFQIADDFEDIEQDKKRDGKNSVMNYCINKGVKNAYIIYFENLKKFKELTLKYNIYTNEINEICNYLTEKVNTNIYIVH